MWEIAEACIDHTRSLGSRWGRFVVQGKVVPAHNTGGIGSRVIARDVLTSELDMGVHGSVGVPIRMPVRMPVGRSIYAQIRAIGRWFLLALLGSCAPHLGFLTLAN